MVENFSARGSMKRTLREGSFTEEPFFFFIFFLEPEDINNISLGVWNYSGVTRLP